MGKGENQFYFNFISILASILNLQIYLDVTEFQIMKL